MKLNCEHGLNESVVVKQLGIIGIVTGILCENAGTQYRVVFWTNGERRQEWLFPVEIDIPLKTIGEMLQR